MFLLYKIESQKIINLLNSNDNDSQKFATKRWYIIQDQNQGEYGDGADGTTIKYDTKVIKPNLCDYSDAYNLVTGNIQNKPDNSTVAFKNCAPFRTCNININDEYVEAAKYLDIIMPMYNLLEYSDNYEDTTGSLYQFKRDEPPDNNGVVTANTTSLSYKSIDGVNGIKLVVPLKYISNFFRSLEMPLVNCKVDLELTWTKDCVFSSDDAAANTVVSFNITDAKLYVPIVTLSTKDNSNLTKQLNLDLKELYIVMNTKQLMILLLLLLLICIQKLWMHHFKESIDYLCLVLIEVIMIQQETDIEDIIYQELILQNITF